MTKLQALKKLFEINLKELGKVLGIDGLKVEFKDDWFFVLDKNDKIIFVYKIKYYDLDFNSQRSFVINVANEIAAWVENLDEYEDDFIHDFLGGIIDSKDYVDILGEGDIYRRYYIKLKNYVMMDDNIVTVDGFDIIKEIKNNLDGNKIRVVLYNPANKNKIGIYVDGVIKEKDVKVYYIEDEEDVEKSESIDNLLYYKYITLYYSMTTKEELEKAVEFIEELVA